MRLLLAQSTVYVPTHGGENKANRLLVEGLAERGHACRVVAPAWGAQGPRSEEHFLAELKERGLQVTSRPAHAISFEMAGVEVVAVRDSADMALSWRREIEGFRPDRILVSSEDPGHVLLEGAVAADPSRVVYVAHTMLFFPFGPNSFAPSPQKTALFRTVAGVCTVSDYLKGYIRQWSGKESVVIPFPAFGKPPFPRLGRHDGKFVTMINPCAYKGITIFLELARAFPDVAFGAVPSWGTTAQDLAALRRQGNVEVLPGGDDLDRLLGDTRVLLVPSLWGEGFPLVPVEAMLRGIPVLASDSGGLPESKLGVDYVLPVRSIERYTGQFDDRKLPVPVVPAQDVGPWRDALRAVLSSPARYEELAATSRRAAMDYVEALSVAPFERYFESLVPAQGGDVGPALVPEHRDSEKGEMLSRVSGLSPERRALLAARLREKRRDQPGDARIPRRGPSPASPLSFGQERLWLLDRLEPGSAAYNNFDAFRLSGRLDVPALERSLAGILRRHESLRTVFREEGGRAVQVVGGGEGFGLEVVDLAGLGEEEREGEVSRLAVEEARRPFDLGVGPLVRARLLRLGGVEHVLLLTMHHIVSDGWSFGVFLRELAEFYGALVEGREVSLGELPIQYGDFAQWQREWLTGSVLEEQLGYWRGRLTPLPGVMELPSDRPRPRVRSHRGARERVVWERGFLERLRSFALSEGVTPFMVLMAGFGVLLHRYTGQEDVAVGTPIAGRGRSELEGLIGFFVNTLVLRVDASGDPGFREFLGRVREAALGAYAHQDLPFEKLVEVLRPERDMSHTPLFQVMLVMQNAPREALELPGLTLRPVEIDSGLAKFDLTLDVTEGEEGLRAELEYSADLFESETVRRMFGHWRRVLEGAMAGPEERLSRLPLLTEGERRQLIAWNPTEAYAADKTVQELFEEQVERSPDAVAVVFGEEKLTYAELNRRANRLAHHLQGLGVEPEVLVGLCLERSIETVVAILAVLKAGGAYVPLDPAYPRERLAFILEDTEVRALISQKTLQGRLPSSSVRQVILDGDRASIASESAENLSRSSGPANAAYVIYTSGSTGKPKGVVVSHDNVVRLFRATDGWYHFDERDVWSLFHSYAFDVSVWEIWGALLHGGRLVVVPHWVSRSPESFLELLADEKVTILCQTPSAFRQLIAADAAGAPDGLVLRAIIFAGEALEFESLRPWIDRHGDQRPRLINMYGPTEATVYVTYRTVDKGDLEASRGSAIGPPIRDMQIYVLDRHLEPVPLGVAGELYVGGAGVARGYLRRPDLTAQRFVADPFAADPGGRLYRSGDLARLRNGGELEYLGRLDHQVKVRGFRIELGEIESRLLEHPGVREAIVIAREEENGDRRLVAYLVAEAGAPVEVAVLRAFLKETLPEYMVPSASVWMDALPLTQNGKVDRRALPEPAATRPGSEATFVAPRSPLEETVAAIFAGVLGVERVGAEDDFFELGGHSLLATQVTSRIRETLHVDLPLRGLFESPTVAGVASAVEQSASRPADAPRSIARRSRAGDPQEILKNLDRLSEEEVQDLLTSLLAAKEVDS